jgi:amidase
MGEAAVDRRTLLKLGALGAGAATLGVACAVPESREEAPPVPQETGPPAFELEEATVAELQRGMEEGRWTARGITELYLERIEEVDRAGPAVNSVIVTNPEAALEAEALDEERRAGKVRGPLHGVPVLLKDNIETGGRMETTAGSLALTGEPAGRDAFLVDRLRAAGVVILGKANLSEWANFRSERSSSGWSAVGGQTRNPYALDRNPCGSSSGSGAAVAANLTALAVGTETDGSVVCPSTANGIVGFKPTLGLVSRTGIVPIAHSQDTAGPMARSVSDAALLLGGMVGVDPRDPATEGSPERVHADYARFLDPRGLEGARIGVARERFGFHEGVDGLMEGALEVMKSAGAEIIDPTDLDLEDVGNSEYTVLLYEFKTDLNEYLAGRGKSSRVKSLEELIAFNEEHRDREMPYFQQEIFHLAEEKGGLDDNEYREARELCLRKTRDEGIDRLVAEHRLDAIVAPTGGPAWKTDLVNGDHFGGGSSRAAAVAGYPNVTVPAGFVFGLPVGISFFGAAWSEPTLLKIAYAFEQATGHREPPKFLQQADLTV